MEKESVNLLRPVKLKSNLTPIPTLIDSLNQKINITTIIIFVQVVLVVFLIFIILNLISINNDITLIFQQNNQTKSELGTQITDLKEESNYQILELTENILDLKKDVNSQINEVKASSSSDFSGIIQDVIKGVVSVGTDVSQGSGFLISSDGYIVTNSHVLIGGRYAKVLLYNQDKWISAKLIGYDLDIDIAILKIDVTNTDYLTFESSSNLQLGEKAIALGNPLGLSFSVTEGIVSGLNREGPNDLPYYIQIDTPLNRGNSGGPLVNTKAKVIGINNFKLQNSENVGFALESDKAVEAINKIFKEKEINIQIELN